MATSRCWVTVATRPALSQKRNCRVSTPTQIEGLLVGLQVGVVDVEPRAVVEPECQGEPVRQIDQALVVGAMAGDLVGEPVVDAGDVGARIVEPACRRLGRATACREVAVSQGAQGFPEPFVRRIVSVEGQHPSRIDRRGPIGLLRQPVPESGCSAGTVEPEGRRGRPLLVFGVCDDDDADTVTAHRPECGVVGGITDEHGQGRGVAKREQVTDLIEVIQSVR